jgi:hypothetical protein
MRTAVRVSSLILFLLTLAVPAAAQVLWDNGPLLTHPAGGWGGADLSAAQNTTVGLTTRGLNHSVAGLFRVADDFAVDGLGWTLTDIVFFAYQGSSVGTTSPITAVNYQIWNGDPSDPGSTVVCGDTTTNRLLATTWTGMYRALLSEATTDNTRPVMEDTADATGCVLPPGTYWLDWQTDGNATLTGPWAAPVSILDQNPLGNALQFDGAAWNAALDAGLQTPLDFPFVIHGTPISSEIFLDGFETGDTSAWSVVVP